MPQQLLEKKKVRVRAPDGRTATVDADELQTVLDEGFTQVNEEPALASRPQGFAQNFLSTFKDAAVGLSDILLPINPMTVMQNPQQAALDLLPGRKMNRMAREQVENVINEDALREQEGRSGAYRATAGVGSLLGVPARQMEEAANAGDVGGVLGATTAAGTMAAAPLVGPKVAGVSKSILRPVTTALAERSYKQAVKVLPDKVFDALKPSPGLRVQVKENLPAALDDVVSFAKKSGNKLESMQDVAQASSGVNQAILEDMKAITAQGVSGDGSRIAKQLRSLRDSITKTEVLDAETGQPVTKKTPGVRNSSLRELNEYIQFFENTKPSLEMMENMRRGVNAKLASFMRKNNIKQGIELKSNPVTNARSTVIEVLKEEIDRSLRSVKSPEMSPLRKRYSQQRSLQDALQERIISDMVADEIGFFDFESLDTLTAGSAVTAAAMGNPMAAGTLASTVAARRFIDVVGHRLRKPDARLQRAFKDVAGSEFVGDFKRVGTPTRKLLTTSLDPSMKGPLMMPSAPIESPAFGSPLTVTSETVHPQAKALVELLKRRK